MNEQEMIHSLKWALGVVRKKAGTLLYSFGDGRYYCAHCESSREYRKRDVMHADDCECQRAFQTLNNAIQEVNENGEGD